MFGLFYFLIAFRKFNPSHTTVHLCVCVCVCMCVCVYVCVFVYIDAKERSRKAKMKAGKFVIGQLGNGRQRKLNCK